MPGPETTYSSIGPRWANVCNTPYRYWKTESYEGGIHTPMIAFWPKGITAKRGSFCNHVGHVMDFMNTFIELAGATYPRQYKGHAILPTTGISLASTFRGEATAGHEQLFNEHYGARYAREKDWKLVALGRDTSHWQLYDLATDRSETKDLAAEHPDEVRRLDSLWWGWARSHQVYPKPRVQ
jgi:arylsulfatase